MGFSRWLRSSFFDLVAEELLRAGGGGGEGLGGLGRVAGEGVVSGGGPALPVGEVGGALDDEAAV